MKKSKIASSNLRKQVLLFFFLLCFYNSIGQGTYTYPSAHKDSIVETYFGNKVIDPYRWLENSHSSETQDWISKQEQFCDDYFVEKTLQKGIYDKLVLYNHIQYKPLIKKGDYYFFFMNINAEESASLYYQKKINSEPKQIINPRKFKNDKNDQISIGSFEVSKNNNYIAFTLTNFGSDWREIRIFDLKTGRLLEDKIKNIKGGGIEWKGNGFFYQKFDTVSQENKLTEKNERPKLYFHTVNTDSKTDILIYTQAKTNTNVWFSYEVTSDESILIINDFIHGTNQTEVVKSVLYTNLDSFPKTNFQPFLMVPGSNKKIISFIDNIGDELLMLTNQTSATNNLLLYNPSKGLNQGKILVPAYTNILVNAKHVDHKIVCLYFLNGKYTISIFDEKGVKLHDIPFPEGFTVRGFETRATDTQIFFFVNSFYFPAVIYKLDLKNLLFELQGKTGVNFDFTKFETKYVYYYSEDSIKIPMYITYRKGMKLNGKNPTLLYGYGGFGASVRPFFDPATIVWMENGGILAVPGIRGGGELGGKWHIDGIRLNRNKVFSDFIFAAEYLIENKYTNPDKLAIEGGSNGGLLVAVAMTKRPDLFKAVIPNMAVLDMLRYQKFTVATQWMGEYGVSTDSLDFNNLYEYSPLHNIKTGVKYPAVFAITADNDDRVPPLHTYKFMATLQEKGLNTNPYIFKLEKNAGHFGAITSDQRKLTDALKLTFLFEELNVEAFTVWQINKR